MSNNAKLLSRENAFVLYYFHFIADIVNAKKWLSSPANLVGGGGMDLTAKIFFQLCHCQCVIKYTYHIAFTYVELSVRCAYCQCHWYGLSIALHQITRLCIISHTSWWFSISIMLCLILSRIRSTFRRFHINFATITARKETKNHDWARKKFKILLLRCFSF